MMTRRARHPLTTRADSFRQLCVARFRDIPDIPAIWRLDLTKILSLSSHGLLVILLFSPAVLRGAEAQTLTLAEAMARAREGAREVTAAAARQEAQAARLAAAKAHRLPRISLAETWLRTDSPADVFGLQLSQERFSFADFVASDPNQPDPLSNATTRLELALPLYTGGELAARIRQAELAAAAAGETAHRTTDEAALAAAEAYIRLAQAREHVALLACSLETVGAHVELARSYVEQGMLVRSELLRAEVEAARVADLLAAARGQAEVAAAALSLQLAADLGTEWELVPLPAPDAFDASLDDWLQGAGERSDLAAARRMQRAAALEVDVHRAAQRPRLGLHARYDLIDDQLFGSHGENAAVAVMASIELFAGGQHRAAREAAMAEAAAVAADVDLLAAGIELQIRQAFHEAKSAGDRQATARGAVAAATEAARIVEERFRQGVVKTIDLLDATTARLEAETRELVARTDAHLARLRLAVTAGRRPESALPSLHPQHDEQDEQDDTR